MAVVKTVWTEDKIKRLLETSKLAVERGVVAIYNLQTTSEKATESTEVFNRVGFNAFDATFGSSLARRILSNRRLTEAQLGKARTLVIKYRKQLTAIANDTILQ